MAKNPKPTQATVVKWRQMAEAGHTYAAIQRKYRRYTVNQIRHYCLGNTGRKLPGPIQEPGRWRGRNVWLQGEKSPHASMKESQALEILNDWDETKGWWAHSAAYWANVFKVSPSAIQQLRRGDTWTYLEHPNQGRAREKPGRKAARKSRPSTHVRAAKGRRQQAVGIGRREKVGKGASKAVSRGVSAAARGKKAAPRVGGEGRSRGKASGATARGGRSRLRKEGPSGRGSAGSSAPRGTKAPRKGAGGRGRGRAGR